MRIKIQLINEYRYFLEHNFVSVNSVNSVLVHPNEDDNAKRFKYQRYYLPKSNAKNYNIIVSGKVFYDQAIYSDIKRYKEIRKWITGQGEDYTTGCLLDYEYIKNYF